MPDKKILTIENAPAAKIIRNIGNPDWGTKRFNYKDQPLINGQACSSWSSGSNGALLFESEYRFWEVIK